MDFRSEKSKGKQRATDQTITTDIPSPPLLTIRFNEGITDLTLEVSDEQHDTVKDIKQQIRKHRPELKARRLRLIHTGRILDDETLIDGLLAAADKKTQVAVDVSSASPLPRERNATWIHCAVGPAVTPEEEDEASRKVQVAQLQPARGFDRLVALGFSESDIANFRQQFHGQSAHNYLDGEVNFETEEEYDEHARAMEERWIDSMDDAGTALVSRSPNNPSILQGVLVGFFFPLIPFYYFRKPHPAVFWDDGSEHETVGTVIFTKSMQVGILLGFLLNLFLGCWRYLFDP